MTIDSCKEYKKLDPSIRKAVDMCIAKLEDVINIIKIRILPSPIYLVMVILFMI